MNNPVAMQMVLLVGLIAVMYLLLIRPQKKRERETNQMRSNIKAGDEIITIGGICGKVVKTKDDTLVIQVGADKVKFEVMRWSISKVIGQTVPIKKAEPEEETAEEPAKKIVPKRMKKSSDEAAAVAPVPAENAADAPAEPPVELQEEPVVVADDAVATEDKE